MNKKLFTQLHRLAKNESDPWIRDQIRALAEMSEPLIRGQLINAIKAAKEKLNIPPADYAHTQTYVLENILQNLEYLLEGKHEKIYVPPKDDYPDEKKFDQRDFDVAQRQISNNSQIGRK